MECRGRKGKGLEEEKKQKKSLVDGRRGIWRREEETGNGKWRKKERSQRWRVKGFERECKGRERKGVGRRDAGKNIVVERRKM